ncbi:MAG: leishmanolysin-related zinc metalloendopeptidase [Pseudomonadota bacterium]
MRRRSERDRDEDRGRNDDDESGGGRVAGRRDSPAEDASTDTGAGPGSKVTSNSVDAVGPLGPETVPGGTFGADGLMTRYVSGGDPASSYNVAVAFAGDGWTADLQADFVAAADYLSRVVTGDVADTFLRNGTPVDDVLIDASLIAIDGPSGVLGRAGPREIRFDALPKNGIMEFDTADAERFDDAGLWDDIVLHEMTHVLGFGTIWGILDLAAQTSDGLRFVGEKATAVYQQEFADRIPGDTNKALGVPVEEEFGPGTAGGHWDEALFDNELMTGLIDGNNYLSMTTIASLDDLGYETVIDQLFTVDAQVLLV